MAICKTQTDMSCLTWPLLGRERGCGAQRLEPGQWPGSEAGQRRQGARGDVSSRAANSFFGLWPGVRSNDRVVSLRGPPDLRTSDAPQLFGEGQALAPCIPLPFTGGLVGGAPVRVRQVCMAQRALPIGQSVNQSVTSSFSCPLATMHFLET